jgi:hypothetical protein
MSYIIDNEGQKKWDENSEFSEEELQIINLSGVTVPKLRNFYARFPYQELDTAVGGCIMEMAKGLKEEVSPDDSKTQDEPLPTE